ncbi:MAG: methionine biosynthesis protein MetW [Rhodospirillaceae bacterium]|nr:methionine biosynthesis protein MetW [Rhodospirillaceae bacterium]
MRRAPGAAVTPPAAIELGGRVAAQRAAAPDRPRRAGIRIDLQLIADMVGQGTRVLDVGCGDGELLDYLVHFKQVDGRGIEISQAGVNVCVSHGLSVIQGDADTDLKDYPSGAFDYVILSQTLQAMRNPRHVIEQLVRIGRWAIVSFPNFGHWRMRLHLLTQGRMPVTPALPAAWFDTPNIHLCTILDFVDLCRALGVTLERALAINGRGRAHRISSLRYANLFGEHGLFVLSRSSSGA